MGMVSGLNERHKGIKKLILLSLLFLAISISAQHPVLQVRMDCPTVFPKLQTKECRQITELSNGWKTWLTDSLGVAVASEADDSHARVVKIPHNWDDYYGCRQFVHGNLHGTAMYVKLFSVSKKKDKSYFLCFEGVGTYATIKVNGYSFGRHPVGRTTFTLDVTSALKEGDNLLEVKAEHPAMITDMPWVCGGCSSEWGFSEGSQPLGIFRPVQLIVTNKIRIEPFGVHVWNDEKASQIFIETEVGNYGDTSQKIALVNKFVDENGQQVFRLTDSLTLKPGERKIVKQQSSISNPVLWSTSNPYLYQLTSMIKYHHKTMDLTATPFGIRTVSWPVKREDGDGRFLLNGKPVFINGICEYENEFGQSHAFSHEQIAARVKEIRAAGFNAFRDAHQPHNLDYTKAWNKYGILCWSQFSAHIWYDTPEFRKNFKMLLRQWIKERRNSPSIIMWGLQNESVLPKAFAQECSNIIREMDPTARTMRVITTCNGGEGTDWNVIQNWSGTYGGNIWKYGEELKQKNQLLNGEYGAWRSIGLHTEPAPFDAKGIWSENRMCSLLETKMRLADQAKDSVCGHFLWVFNSHDNPGRRQPDEAYRKIDKTGPFNYKGLLTPWEEPLDAYYMYRSNYVSAAQDPMVYLVSHTWPDRFIKRAGTATIEAYSNCDSVVLYNDAVPLNSVVLRSAGSPLYLGTEKNQGIGTHFIWDDKNIRYDVLSAIAYYGGEPVARDVLILNGLSRSPHFNALYEDVKPILKGASGYHYLYRVNCGGDKYVDSFGQTWLLDDTQFSHSWAQRFNGLNPYQTSQATAKDPISGTRDWKLFQTFRFGRHELYYHFPVRDGTYRIELYFTEPWYGTGGGEKTDCKGFRLFDVAVNDSVVIKNFDIWAECGHDAACKKIVYATIHGGILKVSFPEVNAGQAVISGIAIAAKSAIASKSAVVSFNKSLVSNSLWADFDYDNIVKTSLDSLPQDKNVRLCVTYQAEDAEVNGMFVKKEYIKQTGVFFDKGTSRISWNISTGLAQVYVFRFKYMNLSDKALQVRIRLVDEKGDILKDDILSFACTPGKWKTVSTTTDNYVNAGHYHVILSSADMNGLALDGLDVQ